MKFTGADIEGVYILELEEIADQRGFFSRAFCQQELEEHGLESGVAQANLSWNRKKGTLRGMHFQYPPYQETKLIRCTRGALYDVIIDLRKDSPTFGQSVSVELTADNRKALYVPQDFAHGFITLQDDTEAFYMVNQSYQPDSEGGIRWNDPRFNIKWPIEPVQMSEKDANWPDFTQ